MKAHNIDRLEIDMTPVKTKRLPIIWIVGPPGTAKSIFSNNISVDCEFEHIKISDLIKNEALNDTQRGSTIKEILSVPNKRVPDVCFYTLNLLIAIFFRLHND